MNDKNLQDLSDEELKEELRKRQAQDKTVNTKKKSRGGLSSCLVLIIVLVGIVFLAWVVISLSGSRGGSKPDLGDSFGAYDVCQQFVEDRLKAPSTADFAPHADSDIENITGNIWHVESYVDSQNSFGAMIRNYFSCTVYYKGNDNWQLKELEIID